MIRRHLAYLVASKPLVTRPDKFFRFYAGGLCSVGAALLFSGVSKAATVVSASHPNAIYYGFNDQKVPFEPFAVPQGVPSGARFTPENGALKITNAFAGSFSVNTKIPAFNADELSDIYFDYKVNPDVKVNFFF